MSLQVPSKPSRKRAVAIAAAVALAVVGAVANVRVAAAKQGVATVGRLAPAFVVERPDGRELSSTSLRGRPLLINVFAAWCGTCRVEEPLLVKAYVKYRDRVAFLGIDEQEGTARAIAFARELHVPYPIAVDAGPFAASYDTSKIPETILIDGRGIVRAVHRGILSAAVLDRELGALARKEQT